MCIKNLEKLIISLIKDDLINSKLIYSLTAIGLNATDYHLHLATTILDIMGFKEEPGWDGVFALYLNLSHDAIRRHSDDPTVRFDFLAREIYQSLYAKLPVG